MLRLHGLNDQLLNGGALKYPTLWPVIISIAWPVFYIGRIPWPRIDLGAMFEPDFIVDERDILEKVIT